MCDTCTCTCLVRCTQYPLELTRAVLKCLTCVCSCMQTINQSRNRIITTYHVQCTTHCLIYYINILCTCMCITCTHTCTCDTYNVHVHVGSTLVRSMQENAWLSFRHGLLSLHATSMRHDTSQGRRQAHRYMYMYMCPEHLIKTSASNSLFTK